MKTSVDDLQEIVKAAVKDAMEENESKEEDPSDDGIDANAADIIEAAIETVNKSRKEGEGISEDDAEDLLNAVVDAEEGKDESTLDIGEILEEAIGLANEKRKSAKSDEINETDIADILDAVSEVMEDEGAEEGEKRRKSKAAARSRE